MRIKTLWEMRTYDVLGNPRDGYEVNDSYSHGTVEIPCRVETYNVGTDGEFKGAYPSDTAIRRVFGLGPRVKISLDGDDISIYVSREHDGYPIGELNCISHTSLSPIKLN